MQLKWKWVIMPNKWAIRHQNTDAIISKFKIVKSKSEFLNCSNLIKQVIRKILKY